MAETLIGKKIGQTTYFEDDGRATHVTVMEVGPCVVIQKKSVEKEGYNALQLGYVEKKDKHTTKSLEGRPIPPTLHLGLPPAASARPYTTTAALCGAKISAVKEGYGSMTQGKIMYATKV